MTDSTYDIVKRGIDIFFSLFLLIFFLPVWFIVPLLIYFDSPGPIIYRHRRIGKNKKPFNMLKFRSMVQNADEILYQKNPRLLQKFKDGDWKLANDPRITKLGKLLRSLTIDEFPQLLNVLKGDMSLVGPRAYTNQEIKEQTKKYPKTKPLVKDVLKTKPGITGVWQTSGRNEIPFDKRAQMDSKYARSKSIQKDLAIIFKTPKAMISKW